MPRARACWARDGKLSDANSQGAPPPVATSCTAPWSIGRAHRGNISTGARSLAQHKTGGFRAPVLHAWLASLSARDHTR